MDMWIFLTVFGLSFATMFMGALSGGVGLVMRPSLILFGYSPQLVIGSSRASSIIGEFPGIVLLYKRKKIDRATTFFLAVPILIGTIAASIFAILADNEILRIIIGIVVFCMALFLLLKKEFGTVNSSQKFSSPIRTAFAWFGTLIIAFLGTLSGGLGPLYSTLYMWLYGKTYTDAAAMWRISGYIGGLIASCIFVIKGLVNWELFIVLSLGFMAGSYFGTKFSLKKGEGWTRRLVIIVAIAGAIKLIFFS